MRESVTPSQWDEKINQNTRTKVTMKQANRETPQIVHKQTTDLHKLKTVHIYLLVAFIIIMNIDY